MKKFFCILLACFMLASVPVHGYAVAVPTTFGVGVEVILPFLLSLLGVQSKNEINTYQELEAYHDEVYNLLVDGLAGMAGTSAIQNWLIRAASGIIDTDSVIWKYLSEYASENYVSHSGNYVPAVDADLLGIPSFNYIASDSYSANNVINRSGFEYVCSYRDEGSGGTFNGLIIGIGDNPQSYWSSYTYNGLRVRYDHWSGNVPQSWALTPSPFYGSSADVDIMRNNIGKVAWLMKYKGVVTQESIASISNAFSDVLTTTEKDNLVDGTSVVQLYNPSALQNGLEIIPGGDPDDDPNLRKIPFAITADWWNLLEQFGDDAVNQSVAAYNALNNIDDGTSTGSVSKAWEALGLGSVVGSALNAEEGLIDLTDENIFPRSSTVQQAVTDNIPSSLVPESPDSGIDNESEQGLYKLPDLRELFPFCIPFDLIDLLSKFVAEPETPEFAIALSTGYSTSTEDVDLHVVDSVASIVRTFELIGFVLALILITRNLIRG